MTGTRPPSPEQQLTFLAKLQRLFAEGDFTATYKFALLISLADLAVELGDDEGDELTVTTRQIGERFIQLYWQQAAPYAAAVDVTSSATVLAQNHGTQAAVITAVSNFRTQSGATTAQQATHHKASQSITKHHKASQSITKHHKASQSIFLPTDECDSDRFNDAAQVPAKFRWVDRRVPVRTCG